MDKPFYTSLTAQGGVLGGVATLLYLWRSELGLDAETVARIVQSLAIVGSVMVALGFRRALGRLIGPDGKETGE